MMPNRPFEDNKHSFLSIRDMAIRCNFCSVFPPTTMHLKQIKSEGMNIVLGDCIIESFPAHALTVGRVINIHSG